MGHSWFRARVAASFGAGTFVAGVGSFTILFGWDHMDTPTVVGQLIPGAITVALVASILWAGRPLPAGKSVRRGLWVVVFSTPLLLNASVMQSCPGGSAPEFIGCALGVAFYMAKVFGSLAIFTAGMLGFLLSEEPAVIPPAAVLPAVDAAKETA